MPIGASTELRIGLRGRLLAAGPFLSSLNAHIVELIDFIFYFFVFQFLVMSR